MTREQEYVERLRRRADYLARRVAEGAAKGQDLTWDRAELGALLWAIDRLAPSADTPGAARPGPYSSP